MPIVAGALMASSGGSDHISTVVGVILAIMGVGTVALLVSQRAQTGGVITTAGSAIGRMICTALSPVTGASCGGTLTNVSSTFNTGCVVVGGQSYCP